MDFIKLSVLGISMEEAEKNINANINIHLFVYTYIFCCVQLLSHVQLFPTPWSAASQALLSLTVS